MSVYYPRPQHVFVNNTVNLGTTDIFGFDYDWTICNYKSQYLLPLIYEMARKHLIDEFKYPSGFALYKGYDPDFAIRGLMFDARKGLLVKLNHVNSLSSTAVFFGRRRLSREEVHGQYSGKHIPLDYQRRNLRTMWDLFCLPEACLISNIIQYFVDRNISFDPSYVFNDVVAAIRHIHISGQLHREVIENKYKYLETRHDLRDQIQKLKKQGNTTFLLTNSSYTFVDEGMKYIFAKHGSSCDDWANLFDIIVTSSDKPAFYSSDRPFRIVDESSHRLQWKSVDNMSPSSIYAEGSLKSLNKLTKWHGERVLYLGDHLYADLLEPTKSSGWRTGMIIKELEDEVLVRNSSQYRDIESHITYSEQALQDMFTFCARDPTAYRRLRVEIEEWEYRRRMFLRQSANLFNVNFGSVFRSHSGPTLFSYFVTRFSDIYTSDVTNVLQYHSDHRFFPLHRKYLPHEPRIME
eukprot:Clim_evm19s39 gene=Clim_evmTU19s39